jgi:hypothetical protein
VAGGLAFVTDRLGIVELHDVCADMRARNLELFEGLGRWVAVTADGALQRLFAEACHRHAWHAELWQRRTPTIAVTRQPAPLRATPLDGESEDRRRDQYRQAVTGLVDELAALRERVDPRLDPSTVRTIDLVVFDLDDIVERIDASVAR